MRRYSLSCAVPCGLLCLALGLLTRRSIVRLLLPHIASFEAHLWDASLRGALGLSREKPCRSAMADIDAHISVVSLSLASWLTLAANPGPCEIAYLDFLQDTSNDDDSAYGDDSAS